jgi:hypothetical protein
MSSAEEREEGLKSQFSEVMEVAEQDHNSGFPGGSWRSENTLKRGRKRGHKWRRRAP